MMWVPAGRLLAGSAAEAAAAAAVETADPWVPPPAKAVPMQPPQPAAQAEADQVPLPSPDTLRALDELFDAE
eukprot:1807518-Alexandrium_andersonii.AAC.1